MPYIKIWIRSCQSIHVDKWPKISYPSLPRVERTSFTLFMPRRPSQARNWNEGHHFSFLPGSVPILLWNKQIILLHLCTDSVQADHHQHWAVPGSRWVAYLWKYYSAQLLIVTELGMHVFIWKRCCTVRSDSYTHGGMEVQAELWGLLMWN